MLEVGKVGFLFLLARGEISALEVCVFSPPLMWVTYPLNLNVVWISVFK